MTTSVNAGLGDPDRLQHSPRAKVAFALAAVPAVFLAVSYVVMCGFAVCVVIPTLMRGGSGPKPGEFPAVVWILRAGLYATLFQWPFYLAWAACSRELTARLRVLWLAYLILMNMFAMPWFLYCKYRGTTQTAVSRTMRHKHVRKWFERT
jgi:hypothetical protein